MMTDEMTCRICGGDLASNRHPALKMHQSLSTCIKILRARAEAAEAELEQLAWRPMSETPKRIGTYVVAMMNAGGDGFYYDSICWLPWEKYKDAAQSDESRRAFTGDCEWFYFEEEWPPIHASHMDYLCWMEPDETGVEEMIWRMEEQGEGHDDENM